MRAIPIPIRKRILELYDRGKSTREIAQFSGFCVAAVRRVRQQFRERRTLEPQTHRCGRKTLLTEERKQRLQRLLSGQPDATLAELGARLDRPFRASTIDLWLRRLGWKFKKNSGRRRTTASRHRRAKGALA
ncbi:MAG TPA: helix-turn-helix domain-containing protein [Candidatus Acidoferrales bacterium]|nr:helix-turn-helix domain-containing protein [Candidatus Acidoferrales bacterium]